MVFTYYKHFIFYLGAAHIKFWKMAETFTGLKLKGELGRFGKTEICDVLGVYPMPDEKVCLFDHTRRFNFLISYLFVWLVR